MGQMTPSSPGDLVLSEAHKEPEAVWVVVTANQKFCAMFTPPTCPSRSKEELAMLATVGAHWAGSGEWTWRRIGATTWDLRSPDGITRYQLFRKHPRQVTWPNIS